MKGERQTCPVDGCDALIPRHALMCFDHWREVPLKLQREVNEAWRKTRRRGGRLGPDAKDDVVRYRMAAGAAVSAVNAKVKEGA